MSRRKKARSAEAAFHLAEGGRVEVEKLLLRQVKPRWRRQLPNTGWKCLCFVLFF